MKCRAVMGMKAKLASIKHASFFNVPLDYFQNNFLFFILSGYIALACTAEKTPLLTMFQTAVSAIG
jgi:hypothetical protein